MRIGVRCAITRYLWSSRSSQAAIQFEPASSTAHWSRGYRSNMPDASIWVKAAITSMARKAKPNSAVRRVACACHGRNHWRSRTTTWNAIGISRSCAVAQKRANAGSSKCRPPRAARSGER